MHTNKNAKLADTHSENSNLIDYGRKVQELLSQSDASEWIGDLWQMYTGYTLFTQEAGHDRPGHDRFVSFRELVFFFQDAGKKKKSK